VAFVSRLLARALPGRLYRPIDNAIQKYGYSGNYASWDDAKAHSAGYDDDEILSRVRDALLKVKRGEAVAERDSVLFSAVPYSFPVTAALLGVASRSDGVLSVLDFGGSLGSSYFQFLSFPCRLARLEWSIVEQPNFVQCGKELFEDGSLRFFPDIAACARERAPNVALLCSVLSYLPEPYALLEELVQRRIDTIVVDRTLFHARTEDRLTVQRVPPQIYQASYPCWVFGHARYVRFMEQAYRCVAEFDSLRGPEERIGARQLGHIWQLKS